ncbi:MAG: hypothetical protein EOP46_00625 [Sphingobacteriaceae bacterium]|nr:MAG: hypothetical protein EOP46_00625 [Sphingobacteriaceae bacterium]
MDNANAIKASNLVRLSALLSAISYFVANDGAVIENILTIGILLLIAYLIRKKYSWVKWLLLVLTVIGSILTIIALPIIFDENIYSGMLTVVMSILQLLATVLLFLPPKSIITPVETEGN